MTALAYPPILKKNGTIGIVSPARWISPDGLMACQKLLEHQGYRVVIHPQNYLQDGHLAGGDDARVQAIMEMFNDPTIDAIICARGGGNTIRIVDKINYQQIKKNLKPFVGFSDITLLLNAIAQQTGMVTFHGPMAYNFWTSDDPRNVHDLFSLLDNTHPQLVRHFPEVECVYPGSAEGVLVGGNITRLELLMSTPYDWSGTDAILFLEDVDEVLYKIDEKLNHLRLAGRFKGIRAILVGEMVDIGDGETGFAYKDEKPFGRDLHQIFKENLPSDIPVCFNFPCGHGKYLTTLPLGSRVKLSLHSRGAELTFLRS